MSFSYYIIPIFVILIFVCAFLNKTNAYDAFIYGAKDGIKTSIDILPYLMSMYIAVKVFDASGIMDDLLRISKIPNKLLLQGFFRSFSSNASLSYMIEIFKSYGPDSKEGIVSSILQGATDTTMYVITLYFGSIG
ncbi:MAG: spore maturation protein, partial [Anaeroplasmataceae bacterium]